MMFKSIKLVFKSLKVDLKINRRKTEEMKKKQKKLEGQIA